MALRGTSVWQAMSPSLPCERLRRIADGSVWPVLAAKVGGDD
jgi:hypothetical protein